MHLIDPPGLFSGERLAACSDPAQLNWPRLFLASNGCARLELSYAELLARVYRNFKKPPSEQVLWDFFDEYASNFLVILYQVAGGVWWAQFVTSEKFLPRYKTARDKASPAPPLELVERHQKGYIEWKKAKSIANQRFQKFAKTSGNLPEISAAVAVAVAVADAKKEAPKASPSSFELPPWICLETWTDFEEMRRKKRAPMTDRARRGIISDLSELRKQGHDPDAVLVQSIKSSWVGVFPIKGIGTGAAHQPKLQILSRPGGAA